MRESLNSRITGYKIVFAYNYLHSIGIEDCKFGCTCAPQCLRISTLSVYTLFLYVNSGKYILSV